MAHLLSSVNGRPREPFGFGGQAVGVDLPVMGELTLALGHSRRERFAGGRKFAL